MRTSDDLVLILGPFCGLPAVVNIPFGQGVCGAVAAQKRTKLVPDVHAEPNHIACDSASQSEIVVPVFTSCSSSSSSSTSSLSSASKLAAVLDIDCPEVGGFDEEDQQHLERITALLGEACDWTNLCSPVHHSETQLTACAHVKI